MDAATHTDLRMTTTDPVPNNNNKKSVIPRLVGTMGAGGSTLDRSNNTVPDLHGGGFCPVDLTGSTNNDYLSSTTKYHDLSPASQLLNSVLCDTSSPPQGSYIARMSGQASSGSSSNCSANATPNPASANSICNDDNVQECLIYLNQELMVLGFQSILNKVSHPANNNSSYSSRTVNISQMINCTHELLQRLQKNMRARDEMESRHSRVNSDLIFLQQTQVKLKDDLEQKGRDGALFQEKERQLLNKVKILTNKLKVKEDEVKKQLSAHQQRETHFRHEIRKKEREATKLKERVHTSLTDKNKDKKMGIDILNLIERPVGTKRGTWKTTDSTIKNQEDMYKSIISKCEHRQKEILFENTELRQSLRKLESQLVWVFNTTDTNHYPDSNSTDSEEECRSTHSSSSGIEITKAHYELPYDIIRHDIEMSFHNKLRSIKEMIMSSNNNNNNNKNSKKTPQKNDRCSSSASSSCQSSPVDKKFPTDPVPRQAVPTSEQSCQTEIVENQDQQQLSFLSDSYLLEEKELFDKRRDLFDERILNFETERDRFTDAAVRLGYDRRDFEKQKAEFLETACKHKPTALKLNPPKSVNVSPNPRRLLFTGGNPSESSRQMFTPDYKQQQQQRTPSTVELYKFLGIYNNANVSVDE